LLKAFVKKLSLIRNFWWRSKKKR